jgi:hypothetical protein
MTQYRLDLRALAFVVLIVGVSPTSASAALRHDGIAAAAPSSAITLVRLKHRTRLARHHRHPARAYGYAPDVEPTLPPAPARAPSYCAGQFQDASPDGLFRDNVGRIRPCF